MQSPHSVLRVGSGASNDPLPSLCAPLCSPGQLRTTQDPQPVLDMVTDLTGTMVAGHAMIISCGRQRGRPGHFLCRAVRLSLFLLIMLQQVSTTTAKASNNSTLIHATNTETPLRYSPLRTLQLSATVDGIPVSVAQAEAQVQEQQVSNMTQLVNSWMPILAILSILGFMQQARGARLARVPDPPAWNPDATSAMPFGTWTQRLMVWGILAVDLDPSQQCAAIVERLGGSARELADALSWQELTQGGNVGGQQLDPVTFLLE